MTSEVNKSGAEPCIVFDHVGIRFGKIIVHRDINFSLYPAEVVTIMGPSGTGKTVLLKLILGLLAPSSGSVKVFGQDIAALDEEGIRSIRKQIGMLFQGAALFDSLSVFDNVAYALRELRYDESEIAKVVEEKLRIVGLPGVDAKFPPELSGGQKKRVGLARALASQPEVILFDEPTTGLDPSTARLIDSLIVKMRDDFGITGVVVTHDMESAKRVSDRWILLRDGYVEAQGKVDILLKENKAVQDFVSGNLLEDAAR